MAKSVHKWYYNYAMNKLNLHKTFFCIIIVILLL